jgi:hypothetical protein
VTVELVFRLVAASVPAARYCRFPLGDSLNQPGPDGQVEAQDGYPAFVPSGSSYWEIGAGISPRDKATTDYSERTSTTPAEVRSASTFVFVTPLSGRRTNFAGTWRPDQQFAWVQKKRAEGKWRDVTVIDGTQLIAWLMHFPAVDRWLAQQISGSEIKHTTTPDLEWLDIRPIGEPPPLGPDLFLVGRIAARERLEQVFKRDVAELRIETHTPADMIRFVAAYVASLPNEEQLKLVGRCLIVLQKDAWAGVIEVRDPHVLVAAFELNDEDDSDTMLLQRARNRGHVVVFSAPPGGLPHTNWVGLPPPREHEIQEALEKAGYKRERARTIAQKCGGSLSSLLRLLQKASLLPEWSSSKEADALVIVEFMGSWHDAVSKDREVAQTLAGKAYGEWIADVRAVAGLRDTPLTHANGIWRMVPRYEAWHLLSRHVFDEHLERFQTIAIEVLGERDPKLDLPPNERFIAPIQGKVLGNSPQLRKGIAETLALLGAEGASLKSCSANRPVTVAAIVVRELLLGKDWTAWASLDHLLPLLAEAAPDEFLDAVENALDQQPSPFDRLFAQEGKRFGEGTYTAGLLWALETLAWSPVYLTRVTVSLGRLDARDPGGKWVNRPMNSLSTIYLPWLPQTTASIEKKKTALVTLIKETPAQAWRLLIALIPRGHGVSMGSHRPSWRSWIAPDRPDEVTIAEYEEHVTLYTELCIDLALNDAMRLQELLSHLHQLPPTAFDRVLQYLNSETILKLDDEHRAPIWNALEDFVREHRKFQDAHWALKKEGVDNLAAVAEKLAPTSRFLQLQRIFNDRDFDLFDETTDFATQVRRGEKRRTDAVVELYRSSDIERLLRFASEVQSPNRLGVALGTSELGIETDRLLLPSRLGETNSPIEQFLIGYVRARFFNAGPTWLETLQLDKWSVSDRLKLLCWFPFAPMVWERVPLLLGDSEDEYWKTVPASAYEATDDIATAARKLLEHNRPYAALRCLDVALHLHKEVDINLLMNTLLAAVGEQDERPLLDAYSLTQLIKYLQDKGADREKLARIEWGYLPLLDRHFGPGPRTLEENLSTDPKFFCHLLRMVFRSEKERGTPKKEVSEAQRNRATNAYRLLTEWRRVPGLTDNDVDEHELTQWIDSALAECKESGHTTLGQQYIGHVFAFSPSGSSGEWPVDAIAKILDRPGMNDMRRGLTLQLFNNRGIHAWDAGEGEKQLAAKYHEQADAIEARGFHRLATAIRELGDSYLRDAERAASQSWDE